MTITIQCTDSVGLISIISTILKEAGCNIIAMREHVAEDAPLFFARVITEGSEKHTEHIKTWLEAALPQGAKIAVNSAQEKKIVVLVTKEYHCLGDILLRNHFRNLSASVACVIGNYEELGTLCEKFDVPFYHISHEGKSKKQFESEIKEKIELFNPDYLVLAKFMRILSSSFIAGFPKRIINIHHSFLPAFIGANPYKQAYERGVKLIGATAHFVTDNLDEGPIIAQQIIHVNHAYTATSMRQAGKEIETAVLAQALKTVFEDRVFVYNNKTVVFE